MEKIVFTLCSNNYLAHAKTLGDSIKVTNPDVRFIIGLTDKLNNNIDYSFFEGQEVLCYDKIGFDFEAMVVKYNIIEFNTAVKPFYFEYLFKAYGKDSVVYYFDPDIVVYSPFSEMHELLGRFDFVLTPHILKPQPEFGRFERVFLSVGVYNLGFIGMRYSDNTQSFLTWWQNRLRKYCYADLAKGFFVDQKWINFIQLLFEKVHVLRSPGYNVAYWNLIERQLLISNGSYYINDRTTPLVFFHFSAFNPNNPAIYNRDKQREFTPENRPDVAGLYVEYAKRLKANRYDQFTRIDPLLNFKPRKRKRSMRQRVGKVIKRQIDNILGKAFNI